VANDNHAGDRRNPANRRIDGPDLARERRRAGDKTAASRFSLPHAPLGSELAGRQPSDEVSETAEALKRAADNDGRV
jgi:hypothetical protein